MSFKPLFSRSLRAAPERLHMAAHSHHLWPDASFEGQVQCWEDAARLADSKWDRIMGEVWPTAQAHVAAGLGTGQPDAIVFAGNTHDLLVRLVAACPRRVPQQLRVLTTDGEFHSARRQLARWAEEGWLRIDKIGAEEPDLEARFLEAARAGEYDLILVSHVLFGTGRVFEAVEELAALSESAGPWVVIDGYHSFMALEQPCPPSVAERAFYLAGGYKYAMAGEGMGLMHCPPRFGPRPPITGWYAEFADLSLSPGMVGYARDAMRFMGATFDASALYRFNAIQGMLRGHDLTTARANAHVAELQRELLKSVSGTPLGSAQLLNPLGTGAHARFLAFRSPKAANWQRWLEERNCITDVRGDVLRIGLGLYHDHEDVERFARLAADLP